MRIDLISLLVLFCSCWIDKTAVILYNFLYFFYFVAVVTIFTKFGTKIESYLPHCIISDDYAFRGWNRLGADPVELQDSDGDNTDDSTWHRTAHNFSRCRWWVCVATKRWLFKHYCSNMISTRLPISKLYLYFHVLIVCDNTTFVCDFNAAQRGTNATKKKK